jgi:phosphoketolase
MKAEALSPEQLHKMDTYVRAAYYLSVGQIPASRACWPWLMVHAFAL